MFVYWFVYCWSFLILSDKFDTIQVYNWYVSSVFFFYFIWSPPPNGVKYRTKLLDEFEIYLRIFK